MSSSADFISRFCSDPVFRRQAERDPHGALRNMGIAVPAGVRIDIVANASRAVDDLFERASSDQAGVMDDALLDGVAGGVAVPNQDATALAQQFTTAILARLGETRRQETSHPLGQPRP